MAQQIYRGFSFREYEETGSFSIYDKDLVKMDLLNHIFTRRGDRVRQNNFGTSIPDIIFENLTEDLLDDVYDELETVFNFDPRVELIQLQVIPNYDQNSLTASIEIRYIELNFVETIDLNITLES